MNTHKSVNNQSHTISLGSVNTHTHSDYKYKLYAFILIASLQIFVNYDNGVIPVMLNWIQEPYNFSSTELGVMGSLPYVGFVASSPFLTYTLTHYNNKTSMTISLILNMISLSVFGLAVNKYMFFISKFCIGATQALFFIYYPLWVDIFAPEKHRNLWMSVIQGGIVVGCTFGYILTSLYSYAGEWAWRYSILTQISCEFILTVLFYLVPKEFVNFDPTRDDDNTFELCTCGKSNVTQSINDGDTVNVQVPDNFDENIMKRQDLDLRFSRASTLGISSVKRRTRIYSNFEHSMLFKYEPSKCSKCFSNLEINEESNQTKNLSIFSKLKLLTKQSVFMLSCFSISALYFEVTGIHYWTTKIGITHLKMNENIVHLIFSIEAILGPVLGILSGSYLIDQIVYHYPNNPLYVDTALVVFGLIPCITSIIIMTIQTPMTFSICIFIILFYGAALVPTLTLTSVAYLPHHLKPAGASFFMCQYQVLGFMLGTLVPGIAVDIFHNYSAGLYIIYSSGFLGLGLLLGIFYIKWKRIRNPKECFNTQ